MSARLSVRIPQELKAKFEKKAAEEGKNISDWLRDHLPELIEAGLDIKFEGGAKGEAIVLPERRTDLANRIKSAVADAVELRTFMSTLGIQLAPTQQPPYAQPQMYPYQQPLQPPAPPKTDIKDVVTEIKLLESLDKTTTDPEIKEAIKELKDAQIKLLTEKEKTPPVSYADERRKRLDDLKEYALTAKLFGGPEERAEADRIMREELQKMRDELHQTQLEIREKEIEKLKEEKEQLAKLPRTEAEIAEAALNIVEKNPYVKAAFKEKAKEMGLTTESMSFQQKAEIAKSLVTDIFKGIQDAVPVLQKMAGTVAPAEVPAPPELTTEQKAALETVRLPPTETHVEGLTPTTTKPPTVEGLPAPEETTVEKVPKTPKPKTGKGKTGKSH